MTEAGRFSATGSGRWAAHRARFGRLAASAQTGADAVSQRAGRPMEQLCDAPNWCAGRPATRPPWRVIMAKVVLGNHSAVRVPRAEQDRIRRFYRDVLGGEITRASDQKDDIRLE